MYSFHKNYQQQQLMVFLRKIQEITKNLSPMLLVIFYACVLVAIIRTTIRKVPITLMQIIALLPWWTFIHWEQMDKMTPMVFLTMILPSLPLLIPMKLSVGISKEQKNVEVIRKMYTKRKGFTLLELLIVIAIISFVASLSAPIFVKFTRNRRLKASGQMLQSMFTKARSVAISKKSEARIVFFVDDTTETLTKNGVS